MRKGLQGTYQNPGNMLLGSHTGYAGPTWHMDCCSRSYNTGNIFASNGVDHDLSVDDLTEVRTNTGDHSK